MADVSFTNLTNLPPEIATNLEAINRKKRIQDALMAQTLQPHQTQMGRSGRYQVAVPYSPLQGATKLIQAAMLNKQSERSNEALRQLGADYRAGGDEAVRNIQAQATGAVPWRNPDPAGAATTGAGSVYPQAQRVSDAMLTQQSTNRGRGNYVVEGELWDDEANRMVPVLYNRRAPVGQNVTYLDGSPIPQRLLSSKGPKARSEVKYAEEEGKIRGADIAQAGIDLPKAEATATETGRITDKLRNHKGMSDVIGIPDNPLVLKGFVPGTSAADFRALLDQITGRTFMEIFPTLKGGGQITEIEGEKGQAAINRMSTSTSEKAFLEALDDFDAEIERLKGVIRIRAGKPTGLPPGFIED